MFNLFSRGDLDVVPEKYQYAFGETIQGRITLKLKTPLQANKISVRLKAIRTSSAFSMQDGERDNVQTIYDFALPLDGMKEYSEGEYSFQINIPADINLQIGAKVDTQSTLGKVVQAAAAFEQMTGKMSSRIDWYLEAELDIPGAIDMRKKVEINIT